MGVGEDAFGGGGGGCEEEEGGEAGVEAGECGGEGEGAGGVAGGEGEVGLIEDPGKTAAEGGEGEGIGDELSVAEGALAAGDPLDEGVRGGGEDGEGDEEASGPVEFPTTSPPHRCCGELGGEGEAIAEGGNGNDNGSDERDVPLAGLFHDLREHAECGAFAAEGGWDALFVKPGGQAGVNKEHQGDAEGEGEDGEDGERAGAHQYSILPSVGLRKPLKLRRA